MKVYTTKEAAKLLRITHIKILQLLRSGELKGFRTSSKKRSEWRIPEAELLKFMSQDGRKQTED